jgi:hypothetical protein
MGTLDSLFDRAASDCLHGAAEIELRLIDELLAVSPEMIESGTGRRWPIFEAAPCEFVTTRIRE